MTSRVQLGVAFSAVLAVALAMVCGLGATSADGDLAPIEHSATTMAPRRVAPAPVVEAPAKELIEYWQIATTEQLLAARRVCGRPAPAIRCHAGVCVAREDHRPTPGRIVSRWSTLIPDVLFAIVGIDEDLSGCRLAVAGAPQTKLMGQNGAMDYLACRAYFVDRPPDDPDQIVARLCNEAAESVGGADAGAYAD